MIIDEAAALFRSARAARRLHTFTYILFDKNKDIHSEIFILPMVGLSLVLQIKNAFK